MPKGKKDKVLTHRPRHIETAEVSKLVEGPSSAAESSHPAAAEAKVESIEELIPKVAPEQSRTLSLLQEVELSKVQKVASITLKRRKMTSVLDAVMESSKALTPASANAPCVEDKDTKKSAEAAVTRVKTEAGPSAPAEAGPTEIVEKNTEPRHSDAAKVPLSLEEERATEGSKFPTPDAPSEELEFMVRHAAGKRLTEEQIAEARQYAKDLKYPSGSLVYSGTDEDDFLYCLPDNKEISVC
jgi:hypothetical protein